MVKNRPFQKLTQIMADSGINLGYLSNPPPLNFAEFGALEQGNNNGSKTTAKNNCVNYVADKCVS